MKQYFITLIFSIIIYSVSFGQGTIRGKITDENGETVIGASINLKFNNAIRTMTDFDGNYSLKIPVATPQIMIITFIGYKLTEETVNPKNGEIVIKNISLVPVSQALKEVEIVATAVKAKDNFMVNVKKKSPTLIDYISAETIKKIGDVNVSSAVARIAGVSTNGAFITVRGIGDRYIKTAINGSRIPTLDPFTNNIKLDLFPASLVDNIIITKTASPDLPGDWAGAYLSVETKDYPEKLSINIESSFGYNNQTTFKDVVSSERSSTDWLGYDNNLREFNHTDFVNTKTWNGLHSSQAITRYDEFVALGLGNYFNSMGITNVYSNQNYFNSNWNDNYTKLGLIKLGLLGNDLFNDQDAYAKALKTFQTNYESKTFDLINAAAVKSSQSLPNNWNTTTRKAPLNFSQSFSIGNQTKLFGKPLGFIAGFRYSSAFQYDPGSTANHIDGINNDGSKELKIYNQAISKETNGWSALLNLAYKYNHNHSISLMFMPNMTGVNNVRNGLLINPNAGNGENYSSQLQSQFYESRKQLVYQLKSEHYIPGPKLKIELNASYTNGKSNAPDFKNLIMPSDTSGGLNVTSLSPNAVHRYFRYLTDDLVDSRLSAELPLDNKPNLVRKLKFGGAYQYNHKISDQYDYGVADGDYAIDLVKGHEHSDPFSPDKFAIQPIIENGITMHTVQRYYIEGAHQSNHNFGNSNLTAAFIMLDYALIPALRLSGGVRMEQAHIYTDAKLFDDLGLASGDARRIDYASGPLINPSNFNKTSYLPSVNIVYKLNKSEMTPVNLRLNFSQTVARPSIRELSSMVAYDYELQSNVLGNPNLKMVQINNYDLRLETYFNKGDNFSLSVFYKDFKNHIELVNNGSNEGYTWLNSSQSWAKGIELEGKKIITKQFDFRANITIVDSRSTIDKSYTNQWGLYKAGNIVTHKMFGQAPYVINGILTYTADSLGLSVALSYNIQGPRLVIEGLSSNIPDVYEMPRNLLDFKISKTLGKHFSASLKVLDIFHSSIRRTYKLPDGYSLDYDKYTYGTSYVFGLSYKF